MRYLGLRELVKRHCHLAHDTGRHIDRFLPAVTGSRLTFKGFNSNQLNPVEEVVGSVAITGFPSGEMEGEKMRANYTSHKSSHATENHAHDKKVAWLTTVL